MYLSLQGKDTTPLLKQYDMSRVHTNVRTIVVTIASRNDSY